MPSFSANFLLAVLATSFLTASAAPVAARAAVSQDQFNQACAAASTAGSLTGAAVTLLDEINTNDQNVANQLDSLKAVLAAIETAGGQVGSICQSVLGSNSNSNNNSNNNNSSSSSSSNNNSNSSNNNNNSKSTSTVTQSSNNAKNTASSQANNTANSNVRYTSRDPPGGVLTLFVNRVEFRQS
ncbi:hypothetical protein C8R44DRAFT_236046 [Mycena epipterygia]|nr:hypothetical protein C8R44DRAFT_236046 [Mycena epipterygia]